MKKTKFSFDNLSYRFQTIFSNRTNVILGIILLLILVAGIVGITKILSKPKVMVMLPEIDMPFTPDGPYAILSPRRDGNALILNISRVSEYDSISYELAYQSSGNGSAESDDGGSGSGSIDRGVQGELNTKDKKSDYSQEILFGTCSKGNTSDPLHCSFDQNVQNGTLTLHIVKGNQPYRILITWHLQKPDIALGVLTSGDNHFSYTFQQTGTDDQMRQELSTIGYSITNDLSGVPKLPANKAVFGKVYAVNLPPGKNSFPGTSSIMTADNIPAGAKIAHYNDQYSKWDILNSDVKDSSISAQVDSTGIFAILTDTK